MADRIEALRAMSLPVEISREIDALSPALDRYLTEARQILDRMLQSKSLENGVADDFDEQWKRLEDPLGNLTRHLAMLVQEVERRSMADLHRNLFLAVLLALLLTVILFLFDFLTSRAVLNLNAWLAAARERAEAASRAMVQFLAAMSHEIRTPLTAVLGMADLLAADRLSPKQRGFVEAIRTSGRHLLHVINDVL